MAKKEYEGEVISAMVPANIKVAIGKALERGLALNESDYLRKATVEKLKKDKLLLEKTEVRFICVECKGTFTPEEMPKSKEFPNMIVPRCPKCEGAIEIRLGEYLLGYSYNHPHLQNLSKRKYAGKA